MYISRIMLLLALGGYAAAIPVTMSAREVTKQVSAAEHDLRSLTPDTEFEAAEFIERAL